MPSGLTSLQSHSNNSAHIFAILWPLLPFTGLYNHGQLPSPKVSSILRISKCCHTQKEVSSHSSAPNVHCQRVTWGSCLDHHQPPTPAASILHGNITLRTTVSPDTLAPSWALKQSSCTLREWPLHQRWHTDIKTNNITHWSDPSSLLSPSTAARNSFTLGVRPIDTDGECQCPQQSQHTDP